VTTKALVIGINNYAPPNTLPSCVNDADAFSGILKDTYNFDEITILKNSQATRTRISDGLTALFTDATPDDRLVFFYSGHGYTHAVGGIVEEALVGQDLNFYNGSDLVAAMQDLPSGILTIVLDSCFSGGVKKFIIFPEGKIEVAQSKRFIPVALSSTSKSPVLLGSKGLSGRAFDFLPFGFAQTPSSTVYSKLFRPDLQVVSEKDLSSTTQVVGLQDPGSKGLLLSACLATETAAASTSDTNGLSAYTFCLTQALANLDPNVSAIALVEEAGKRLQGLNVSQTPLVKEPLRPSDLGSRSFVLLNQAVDAADATTTASGDGKSGSQGGSSRKAAGKPFEAFANQLAEVLARL
jgi:hypothetical protein